MLNIWLAGKQAPQNSLDLGPMEKQSLVKTKKYI